MLIPSFGRSREKNDPAKQRMAQFRALITAAAEVPFYRSQIEAAGLRGRELETLDDIPKVLNAFAPVNWARYTALFTGRIPGWRQKPEQGQTRSAVMLPYAVARAGLLNCRMETADGIDLYSPVGMAGATADLYMLAKALGRSGHGLERGAGADCAMVVFSGPDAGAFTAEQRDQLWDHYQVPVFEQFLGTDGRVIAWECEVHAGLHVRVDGAIVETAGEELVMTSLSDLEAPAIRVRTGLRGLMEYGGCDCGRVEPRIQIAETAVHPQARRAVA